MYCYQVATHAMSGGDMAVVQRSLDSGIGPNEPASITGNSAACTSRQSKATRTSFTCCSTTAPKFPLVRTNDTTSTNEESADGVRAVYWVSGPAVAGVYGVGRSSSSV